MMHRCFLNFIRLIICSLLPLPFQFVMRFTSSDSFTYLLTISSLPLSFSSSNFVKIKHVYFNLRRLLSCTMYVNRPFVNYFDLILPLSRSRTSMTVTSLSISMFFCCYYWSGLVSYIPPFCRLLFWSLLRTNPRSRS